MITSTALSKMREIYLIVFGVREENGAGNWREFTRVSDLVKTREERGGLVN
jgi:hypothetical protein